MTSRSVRQLVIAILFLMMVAPAWAQTGHRLDLDAFVARSMKTFEVPGMAVAIVKDGKVVLLKGYGVRKLGETTPVDGHTLFGIGSNTKAFTASGAGDFGGSRENFVGRPGVCAVEGI